MQVIIGEQVNVPVETNVYTIEIKMMHGDADYYSNGEVVIPQDELDYLKEVLQLLKEMKDLSSEEYSKIDLFQVWFGSNYYGEWTQRYSREEIDAKSQYSFGWEQDITCMDYLAALDSYKVFYYDTSGRKYEVTVVY